MITFIICMLASNLELLHPIKLETAFILANGNNENIAFDPVMSPAIVRRIEIIGKATKKNK